ncbi:AAA family ATPase [Metabacillus dongyingensis]|uniref:AAA family ATPase n=1 Tax=Metabacillus dongyingensis TaxID=2874282 RepID=UPI001CC16454|nr:AAA family ATPase [Metabacillus dongyingensis]UAL52289.1 AAA family ATPase [Metabacillus dongyingensis]
MIKTVKIKNFRGYGINADDKEGFYVFDYLDSNFVLLSGYNGFGKTSFFEAIEWCLTDKIRRLEKFEETYHVNDLKRAQYLKFHNSLDKQERKIEVEIIFDNNIKICRTSYSTSHFAGNGDNYDSELRIFNGNDEIEDVTNATIFKLLIPDIEDLVSKVSEVESKKEIRTLEAKYANTFLNTNMLTQENLSFFLRSTDPNERRSMFMKLLNLSDIDSLYSRTSSMRRGKSFSNKKREISDKIVEISEFLEGISSFFKLKNLGSIEEYISTINNRIENFYKYITENEIKVESFDKLFSLLPVTLTNYAEFMIETENNKDIVLKSIDKFQKNNSELSIIKDEINKLLLLKIGLDIQKKIEQSQLLKDADYTYLLKEEKELIGKLESINNRRGINTERINQLSTFLIDFSEYRGTIDDENLRIKENLWELLLYLKEIIIKFDQFLVETLPENVSPNKINSEEVVDIYKLRTNYEDLVKQLDGVEKELAILETEYSTKSTVNEQNLEMLKHVRGFIVENSKDITECPVCLNSNFDTKSSEDSTASHILSIINSSISAGNDGLRELSQRITNSMLLRTKINESIETDFITVIREKLQNISNKYMQNYELVNGYLTVINTELELEEEKFKKQTAIIVEDKNRYEECYKAVFKTDQVPDTIKLENLISQLDKISEEKETWYINNKDILGFSIIPNKEEIEQKIVSIKQRDGMVRYYPDNLESLQSEIDQLISLINLYKESLKYLEEVIEIKLNDNYLSKLQKYNEFKLEEKELNSSLEQIEKYEEALKKLHENLIEAQKKAVQNQLSNHPIITWIYESINPHPFYNKLVITSEENGTNFKNSDSSVNLDQIFSSAQLNILALSIFLGLGLSQEYSNIKQLFLDDPIQSMDDVNILAFIDVLRAILDSKSKHKKIILSTHDDNFAKLLSIKMRNRSFVEYKFSSYGIEGPIIERITN